MALRLLPRYFQRAAPPPLCLLPDLLARLETLPPEVLVDILSRLPGRLLSLLSRYHLRWANAMLRVYTFDCDRPLGIPTYRLRLRRILIRFIRLREIIFDGCFNVDDSVMSEFRQIFFGFGNMDFGFGILEMPGIHIRRISLVNCVGISQLGFQHVAYGCRHLTSLTVSGTIVNDAALQEFAFLSTPLIQVTLSNCQFITDDGIHFLLVGCPTIRHIHVSESLSIRGYGFSHAVALESIGADRCRINSSNGIMAMVASPALVSLSMVRGVPLHWHGAGRALIQSLSLIYLNMADCGDALDSASIIHIAQGCPLLEEFSISYCSLIYMIAGRLLRRACV